MSTFYTFVTIFLNGFFWRLGGDGFGEVRNPGVPILLGISKTFILAFNDYPLNLFLALLYIPALWAMIQLFSYGLTAPPHKFWVWVFGKGENGNSRIVEVVTRATCGFFWALPAAIFAYITGNWGLFSIYVGFFTIANGLIGGLVKDVTMSECCVGFSLATCLLI